MKPRDIPNLITALRILLVFPIAYLLLSGRFHWALGLFLLAGVSDGIDGFLARRFGWRSRLGSILDPLADKLLMVTVFLVLGWLELVPWWLVVAVLLRDVVIVAGGLAYHLLIGEYAMEPAVISKFNTTVQISLVLVVLLGQIWPLPTALVGGMIYLSLATTVLSGLHYVLKWSRRAWRVVKYE